MNYFGFYEIPLAFNIDEPALRTKFYQLSKQFHPDYYTNQPEEKQQEMLLLSTLNNKAFKTLGNFEGRVKYILSLEGLLEEGENPPLAPAFLMEMMDINEALDDLQQTPDEKKLQQLSEEVGQFENDVEAELKAQALIYDSATDEGTRKITLERIRESYHKSKYLLRLRETLNRISG